MRLVFDIEADGLLDSVTKVHCIVAKDVDTGVVTIGPVTEMLDYLVQAEELIGHNIISFDIPAIQKLYPWWKPKGKIFDTLVASRLIYSNIVDRDMAAINGKKIDKETFKVWNKSREKEESAVGRHGLEAWGLRLGCHKGDFGRNNDWSVFSQEMLDYCVQDVHVTHNLHKILVAKNYSQDALDLEMRVQQIIFEQEQTGWEFDVRKAQALYADLLAERVKIEQEISQVFTGWYTPMKKPEFYFIRTDSLVGRLQSESKKELEDNAYRYFKVTGQPKNRAEIKELIQEGPLKQKYTAFLPNSRHHVARAFKEKYDWVPVQYNEDGSAKCDAAVLKTLPYPEAQLLLRYEVLQDRIEKVAEGKNGGWLDQVKNGRIHGYCNPLGTVTYRGTHANPNLAQVPAKGKEYGKQCRELFTAKPGYVLVGSDASGQELRCLAHYMAEFDGGEFAHEVVSGDVHRKNQEAANLPTRDNAKTFIYAFLYGAGDEKIGKIIGKGKKVGKELKDEFLEKTPALARVLQKVQAEARKYGYIQCLDDRITYIRSEHAALNSLLQCCGAILTKRWFSFICEEIAAQGLDAKQVGWVHDEVIYEVREDQAQQAAQICIDSMKKVEEYYKFRCKLDAEAKIGKNWLEIH